MNLQNTPAHGQSPMPTALAVADFVLHHFDESHKETLTDMFEGWLCSDLTDGQESPQRRKVWSMYQDLTTLLDLRKEYHAIKYPNR